MTDRDDQFVRASGECICEVCGRPYWKHPHDPEVLDYEGRPFLRMLCDGRRVKL